MNAADSSATVVADFRSLAQSLECTKFTEHQQEVLVVRGNVLEIYSAYSARHGYHLPYRHLMLGDGRGQVCIYVYMCLLVHTCQLIGCMNDCSIMHE